MAGFERKLPPSSPKIRGKEVTLAEAVKEAASLIGRASNPLFGGLGTDVEGMRAAMALAERAGGVVDHALSEGQYRNIRVLQSTGWTTSTLTETRNRADLIIVVGSDMRKLHPRFFERIVSPPDSMFGVTAPKRTVVLIGEVPDRKVAAGAKVGEIIALPCKVEQVGEVLGALRARLRGFRISRQDRGRHPDCQDRYADGALPQGAIRRGGVGAANARRAACRAYRGPDRGAREGSQRDAALRRPIAWRQ